MGFVVCKCGERISDTDSPNSNEGAYVSTFVLDDCADITVETLPTSQMWECPKCGALILSVADGKVRHYRTDDGPAGLFQRSAEIASASQKSKG